MIPYDRSWVMGFAWVLYRRRDCAVPFGQCLSEAHRQFQELRAGTGHTPKRRGRIIQPALEDRISDLPCGCTLAIASPTWTMPCASTIEIARRPAARRHQKSIAQRQPQP